MVAKSERDIKKMELSGLYEDFSSWISPGSVLSGFLQHEQST